MKNKFLMLACAVLSAMAFVACSDVEEPSVSSPVNPDGEEMVNLTFTGNMNNDAMTRVNVGNLVQVRSGIEEDPSGSSVKFLWEEGDVVYINGVASKPLTKNNMKDPTEFTDWDGSKRIQSEIAFFQAEVPKAAEYKVEFRGKQAYTDGSIIMPDSVGLGHFPADYATAVATESEAGNYSFTLEHHCCYIVIDMTFKGDYTWVDDPYPTFKDTRYVLSTYSLAWLDAKQEELSETMFGFFTGTDTQFPVQNGEFQKVTEAGKFYRNASTPFLFGLPNRVPKDGDRIRMYFALRIPQVGDIGGKRGTTDLYTKYTELSYMAFYVVLKFLNSKQDDSELQEEEAVMLGLWPSADPTSTPKRNYAITPEQIKPNTILFLKGYIHPEVNDVPRYN